MITADFKLKCQSTSFVCNNSYNKDFVTMTIKKSLTYESAQNFPHHLSSLFFFFNRLRPIVGMTIRESTLLITISLQVSNTNCVFGIK